MMRRAPVGCQAGERPDVRSGTSARFAGADWAVDYRIDVDDAVVLDVLERAVALVPGDRLLVDAMQVVGALGTR